MERRTARGRELANSTIVGDECVVRVFGSTDEAQWYNMWEAAVAVFSVCVRGAKGGVVRNLGESAFLKMEVADVTSIYV